MKIKFTAIILITLFVCSAYVEAETDSKLERLQSLRAEKIEGIQIAQNVEIEKIDVAYFGELKKLKIQYTKQGDLKSANYLNSILLKTENTDSHKVPYKLKRLQSTRDSNVKKITKRYDQEYAKVAKIYSSELKKLKAGYIKDGDLESANAVNEALACVQEQVSSNRSPIVVGATMHIGGTSGYKVWLNGKQIGVKLGSSLIHGLDKYTINIVDGDILAIEVIFKGKVARIFCSIVLPNGRSWGTGTDWHSSSEDQKRDWAVSDVEFGKGVKLYELSNKWLDVLNAYKSENPFVKGDAIFQLNTSTLYLKERINFKKFHK